jgi:O-antigen/teichoic acid export membrane protein
MSIITRSDNVDGVEMTTDARGDEQPHQPVTGRRLVENVLWNILGRGVPILVALASIPILSRSLGVDRFGLLMLCWTFIGYFSIFDLGLATAMERSVAQKLALGDHKSVPVVIWTTLLTMLALGIAGFVVAWMTAPAIIHALRASSEGRAEALQTVHLLALSIPLVIASVGLQGILVAHMKFKLINVVGIPLGLWTYVGPIIVLPISHSLVLIVAALFIGRVAGFVLYLIFCLRVVPSLRSFAFHRALVRPLLTFGGWLTLDDLVDPLVNFLDRFLIGSLISVAAVALYSVPYQLAAQGWIVTSGVSAVLFPYFSGVLARGSGQARLIFRRAIKYLLFAMFPVALIMVAFAQPGLGLWLGADYAMQSTPVLQLVAVGVLITSIGSVGGTFNGSAGRPDIDAKLGLMKFALHIAPAWLVITRYGIVGLAALWVACTSVESLGMVLYALRAQGVAWPQILRRAFQSVPIWVALGIAAIEFPIGWKFAYVAVVLVGLGLLAWHNLMSQAERRAVRCRLGLRLVPEAASGS